MSIGEALIFTSSRAPTRDDTGGGFQLWYTGTAQVDLVFSERPERVGRWSMTMLDLLGYH